jgi:hypothetical protein
MPLAKIHFVALPLCDISRAASTAGGGALSRKPTGFQELQFGGRRRSIHRLISMRESPESQDHVPMRRRKC